MLSKGVGAESIVPSADFFILLQPPLACISELNALVLRKLLLATFMWKELLNG
jgi:hypothetical protein